MTWTLELPYERPHKGLSANYRGHWAPKARSTAQVRALVVALARKAGIPPMGRMQVELVWVVTDLAIIAENGLIGSGGRLLPTPRTTDMNGAGAHGDGGMDLRTAVTTLDVGGSDHAASEDRSSEVLQRLWSAADEEEIRERSPRGSRRLPAEEPLLEEVRGDQAGRAARLASVEGEQGDPEGAVRTVPGDGRAALASSRSGRDQQRPEQPSGAVPVVSSEAALAGGLDLPRGTASGVDWGPYWAAIERWERVLGRAAPSPVLLDGKSGKPRLSAAFCEWMMGWPLGWVTAAVIGLKRAEQLKACGNGVVTLQAAAALRIMLARPGVPHIHYGLAA